MEGAARRAERRSWWRALRHGRGGQRDERRALRRWAGSCVAECVCVMTRSLRTRVRGLLCFHLRMRRHLRPTGTPASSGLAASAGNCAPQAAAAPASSAARRPYEDATRSVAAAAGTARGCAHGVRNALALAAKSTAIETPRMLNEGWGGNAGPLEGGRTSSGRHAQTYNTRVLSKVRSLANLAAASATCQPASVARRSQARRGAHPPQRRRMPGSAPAATAAPPTALAHARTRAAGRGGGSRRSASRWRGTSGGQLDMHILLERAPCWRDLGV